METQIKLVFKLVLLLFMWLWTYDYELRNSSVFFVYWFCLAGWWKQLKWMWAPKFIVCNVSMFQTVRAWCNIEVISCLFIATSLVFSYNNGGQEREHVVFMLISVLDLIVYFFISNYVPKVLLACSINHISHSFRS